MSTPSPFSGCGKTSLLDELITNRDRYFDQEFTGIIIMYNSFQPIYTKWSDMFEHSVVVKGIPETLETDLTPGVRYIAISDDLQSDNCKSSQFLRMQTAGRHMGINCLGVFI